MSDDGVDLDGRRLRTRRSREALSRAAFDLLNERGLGAVAVEDIAVRAGVTRRTFSRHFTSIADAVLGDVDQDVHLFNDALCRRPADESPLRAYRNAIHDWFEAEYGGERAVLLAPEQTFFLRENLKLKLLNARLGVLARQFESARADLAAATAALNKYFDPASRRTQNAASTLQTAMASMKAAEQPRLDETLSALATAAAGR